MNSINHEGKGSPKHSVYNYLECDDCSHTSEENCQERKAAQLLEESMSRQLNDKEKVCNTQ